MKFIFPTVVKVAESLNEVLNEFITKNGDEVEIEDFMLRYTADVIGTTAFGIECNSLKDPNAEFINMARCVNSKPRHSAQFIYWITSFPNLARKLGIKILRDEISTFFMNILKETVDYRETNNVRRNDFMDILIRLKNDESSEALTFNEIAGQAWIFFLGEQGESTHRIGMIYIILLFLGGFDSTSLSLDYCLYNLAMNPNVQKKARKIILEAFERHNDEFTYEMLPELSYIEQVIKGTFSLLILQNYYQYL